MSMFRPSRSPNLLGPSLSRRPDPGSEPTLNHGSTISRPTDVHYGQALYNQDMYNFLEDQTPRPLYQHSITRSGQQRQGEYIPPYTYSYPSIDGGTGTASIPSSSNTDPYIGMASRGAAFDTFEQLTLRPQSFSTSQNMHGAAFSQVTPHTLNPVLTTHPRVRDCFANPCNCNNIICFLYHCGSSDPRMSEPACFPTETRIAVRLAKFWAFIVEGGDSSQSRRGAPVLVRDIVLAIHQSLHTPVIHKESKMIRKEEPHALDLMEAHMRFRMRNVGDVPRRIDFLARHCSDRPMYLRPVVSDAPQFAVTLFY